VRKNLVIDGGFNHGLTKTSTQWEVFGGLRTYCRIVFGALITVVIPSSVVPLLLRLHCCDLSVPRPIYRLSPLALEFSSTALAVGVLNNFSGAIDGRPVLAYSLLNPVAVFLTPHRS